MSEYIIPAGYGEAEYVDKKSRFIGQVQYARTEAEAMAFVESVRKKYADATHNVWAYVLNSGAMRWSDDGEPGGTSGQPTLNVFRSAGVSDVCCVVTRYFGGILLGSGGLVRAYTAAASGISLGGCIEKGLTDAASAEAKRLVAAGAEPLEVINSELIPALDRVGKGFEAGTLYLPQLLMSAEAAGAAFEALKAGMKSGGGSGYEGKIVIATVKGDIHDIGKNIVRTLLENYGFEVRDLGKDVAPEAVLEAAREPGVRLVGLSALMTTTVAAMAETIKLLQSKLPGIKIMVGGAVLNEEYAEQIGADFYGKDAMASVRYAKEICS